MTAFAYVVVAWLLLVGLYGVITSRHLVHLIICLSVCQSSTYVLLLTIGYRAGGAARSSRTFPSVRRWSTRSSKR